jgi:hypothetical protein
VWELAKNKQPLQKIKSFKNFTLNEELDVSPETLYSEATGAPLPSWVEQ